MKCLGSSSGVQLTGQIQNELNGFLTNIIHSGQTEIQNDLNGFLTNIIHSGQTEIQNDYNFALPSNRPLRLFIATCCSL
jgi:hypothetical protein